MQRKCLSRTFLRTDLSNIYPAKMKMLALCPDEEIIKIRHVFGHVTEEDLEQVIETVEPSKLISHHTDADKLR